MIDSLSMYEKEERLGSRKIMLVAPDLQSQNGEETWQSITALGLIAISLTLYVSERGS